MTGLYYAPSELETSLGMERRPESVTQASGLNNLGPSAGDIFALQQDIQRGTMALAPPPAPVAPAMLGAPSAPPAYYSPSTGQMFAGGRTFNQRDVQSALAAAQQFTEAAAAGMRPPAEVSDWRPMTRGEFDTHLRGLSERRGTGELLARGARAAVGGVVSGVGRGIEMFGAPETGRVIAGAGEAITGQDEFDQQRSALIRQQQGLGANIIDAAIESLPVVIPALLSGGAGALAAGAAARGVGLAGGRALSIAQGTGGVGGAMATTFPMHLSSMYEQARDARTPDGQKAYDETSPQVQREILNAAVFNSVLDAIAPGMVVGRLSSALTNRARQATDNAVTGWARARSVGGAAAGSSITEAGTEVIQTLVESATFDPEFRRLLSADDMKALAPYMVERYGENAVIAAGAGALLGAGFGGAGRILETRQPRDVLQGSGQQPPAQTPPTPPDNRGRDLGGGAFGPPAPEQFGPFGPEQLGPFGPLQPTVQIGTRTGTEQFGPPTPIGTRTGTEQFGPFGAEQFGPFGAEQFGPFGPEQFGPPAPEQFGPFGPEQFGPPAPQPFGPPAPTPTERQAVQDAQIRARVNASAPRPDVTFDPADPASTRRAMESFGLSVEEVLSLRDPARALAGTPITVRDVNEAAALAGRTRSAGAPAARPLPTVSAPLAQAMQDAGLTMDDVVAVRNRLQAGAVTYEDVRRAARAKGVDLPVRLRVAPTPATVAPVPAAATEAAPTLTVTGRATYAGPEYDIPVEVLSEAPQAGPDGVMYQRVRYEGRDSYVPSGQLRSEPSPAAPKVPRKGRGTKPSETPKGAARLRGGPRAAETGQVAEGRVEQRPDVNEGGAAPEAGRGNRALRRPAQTQAPAQEVAAPGGAAPRPLEQPAPARAAAQRLDYDAQIDRAERNGELRELRADLEARIDRESEAGRNTADLSRALARVNERLAAPPAAATAEGVLPPDSPQSRWAAVMDDEGTGYNRLSPEARREWDRLVNTGTLPTAEMARQVVREFPSETTQRKLAVVARRKKQLDEGQIDNERQLDAIFKDLTTLAEDADLTVAEAANAALGRGTGQFSLTDWNTRSNWKNADGTDARPMAPGRVQMLVQNFLSKLATKPKVTVVANQQALRRSNPALFAQANAARPQGDFLTANAAGYSFGDGNVIIFTDRIANEQHLRFVLAHETFGHFGLRGIMPRDKFDAAMEAVYDADPQAQLAVDAAMEVRGLSKSEAVEEYLSDYASMLATSTVARVWNAIKRFLNALGVKSGDSVTRYLLDQSRRYVREGRQGAVFESSAVMSRAHTVESGINADGRYSPAAAFSVGAMAQPLMDKMGGLPTNMGEALNDLMARGSNAKDIYNDFKNKYLRLTAFKATDNPGAFAGNQLIGRMGTIAMALKTRMNENLRAVMNSDKATKDRLSKVMYAGRSYKIANFDTKVLNGPNLFSVSEEGDITPNEPEVEKLFKAGMLSLDQIRTGFKWTRKLDDGTVLEREFKGDDKFTAEDYAKYESLRRVVMDAELELLKYQYSEMLANRRVSYREMKPLMKAKKIDKADRAFVDAYVKKYGELYTENANLSATGLLEPNPDARTKAEEFLRATHTAFLARGTDLNAAIKPFFKEEAEANKFIDQMMAMRQRRANDKDLTEAQRFILQNEVKALFLNSHNFKNFQRHARKNIAQGFVSAVREGQWQTQLEATVNGKRVEVKDVHQQLLIYSQFGSRQDAEGFRDGLNKDLEGQTFELLVRNASGNFEKQQVTLRASSGRVLDAVAADPQLNLQQFLYGLSLFNIDVNPRVMEKIVTRLSRQGAGARGRLEFSETPGYDDTQGIFAVSRYTEKMASAAARAATRPGLRELMNLDLPESFALWDGNAAGVERLRQEVARVNADPDASSEAKAYYKGELARAENMLRKTQPKDGTNRRNEFYNDFSNLVNQLDSNKFVDESDFFADPLMSRIRAATAMAQLGGSVAQSALNGMSAYTNFMPFMASKNEKTGFGGGFSVGKVVSEYHRAFANIGAPGAIPGSELNDASFYTKMANDPALLKKYRMTADEARVVAREILEGKLQPAQNNALMGMARGTTTNKWALKFMDAFMAPFNLSEQAVRRSAFLSAYRLYRDRARAAGLSDKEASSDAREKALQALDLTLGEYSVMNRPPAWRSGPTQFLYMYKVYPTTTIQLLKRLGRGGQLSMLGGLWLLAGATGLPFAEDLEDLIDTLAQQLGFQQGSIRAEIIRHLEDVLPGWSPIILKGLINQFGLADVAARTGMGNVLPGTSMGLAGANVARELGDILGPAAGFVSGLAGTARDIVTYPFSSTKTLEDIARNSPVTLLRMMGDAAAYYSSGAVVDRRGYVVSPDMDVGTLIVRLLGFYPERAATQYDIIRIAQRESDYQKEVVAAYRQAWIKATMRGDTQGAQGILEAVNNWNEGARGTPLEITRFLQNSVRALREAQRGAGERALRAAPTAAREDIQGYIDALTE